MKEKKSTFDTEVTKTPGVPELGGESKLTRSRLSRKKRRLRGNGTPKSGAAIARGEIGVHEKGVGSQSAGSGGRGAKKD